MFLYLPSKNPLSNNTVSLYTCFVKWKDNIFPLETGSDRFQIKNDGYLSNKVVNHSESIPEELFYSYFFYLYYLLTYAIFDVLWYLFCLFMPLVFLI